MRREISCTYEYVYHERPKGISPSSCSLFPTFLFRLYKRSFAVSCNTVASISLYLFSYELVHTTSVVLPRLLGVRAFSGTPTTSHITFYPVARVSLCTLLFHRHPARSNSFISVNCTTGLKHHRVTEYPRQKFPIIMVTRDTKPSSYIAAYIGIYFYAYNYLTT